MSYIDIIIILPLLYGIIRGVMRGIVSEAFAIVGIILGILVARIYAGDAAGWLAGVTSWNIKLLQPIVAFSLFLLVALACKLAAHVLTKLIKLISLGWVNRLVGALFGAAKWMLIVSVIIACVDLLDGVLNFISPELKDSSLLYPLALRLTQSLREMITAA